jgi:hypothetical protein
MQEDVVHAEQEDRVDAPAEESAGGRHAAKDGEDRHPLINLERDPNPGVADHAAPEQE